MYALDRLEFSGRQNEIEVSPMKYVVQHEVIERKRTGLLSGVSARDQLQEQIQCFLDTGVSKGWKPVSTSIAFANSVLSGDSIGDSYDVLIVWEIPN